MRALEAMRMSIRFFGSSARFRTFSIPIAEIGKIPSNVSPTTVEGILGAPFKTGSVWYLRHNEYAYVPFSSLKTSYVNMRCLQQRPF